MGKKKQKSRADVWHNSAVMQRILMDLVLVYMNADNKITEEARYRITKVANALAEAAAKDQEDGDGVA